MEKEMKETMTSAVSAKLALFGREIVEKADILFAGRLWLITMAAIGFVPGRPGDMLFFIRFALLILLLHTAAVHFTASLLGGKGSAKGLLAGFALSGLLYIIYFFLKVFFSRRTRHCGCSGLPSEFCGVPLGGARELRDVFPTLSCGGAAPHSRVSCTQYGHFPLHRYRRSPVLLNRAERSVNDGNFERNAARAAGCVRGRDDGRDRNGSRGDRRRDPQRPSRGGSDDRRARSGKKKMSGFPAA